MVKVTSFVPVNFAALELPDSASFGIVGMISSSVLRLSIGGSIAVEIFGPFEQSDPHDRLTKINLLDGTGAVKLAIANLALDEANLVATFTGTSQEALARILKGSDDISLSGGNDRAMGFAGNDTMRGGGGADKLFGGAGADSILGGAGADWLYAGAGNDKLTGGAGADSFVFNSGPISTANTDKILDFNAADDRLCLENNLFRAFTYTGQIHAENLAFGTAASDATDFLIYQKSTGSLWYDADGKAAGAKVLIADLVDGTAVTAADIFLI